MATGLDRIIEKIAEEAQTKCAEIDAASKKEAQALWERAIAEAAKEAEAIIAQASAKAAAIKASGTSGAEAVSKRHLLETKNAVINDVISAAYEKLAALPAKEYFDVLVSLCAKNSQQAKGVMHLNKADLRRMPADFEKKLAAALAEGHEVSISNIAFDIANGFILSYGDVEINCTFKALFDESKDELKDIICPILFG